MCNSKFHKNAPKNDYIRRRKVLNQQEDNENFMLFQKELHVWSSLWILQKKCFSIFKYSLQSAVSLGKIWEEEWQEKVGWQASSPLVSFPAYSQDGHIVSLNKSNGVGAVTSQPVCAFRFTESARLCSFFPRSPHAAAGGEPQPCLLYCWMATVLLAFWLKV